TQVSGTWTGLPCGFAGIILVSRSSTPAADIPTFYFSSRRRHTRSTRDWSSDVCSSDLTADQGRTTVRNAAGEVETRHKFLFFRSDPAPGPGSEVMVPVKDLTNPTNYVALVSAIAQILASTIAIVVVARRL